MQLMQHKSSSLARAVSRQLTTPGPTRLSMLGAFVGVANCETQRSDASAVLANAEASSNPSNVSRRPADSASPSPTSHEHQASEPLQDSAAGITKVHPPTPPPFGSAETTDMRAYAEQACNMFPQTLTGVVRNTDVGGTCEFVGRRFSLTIHGRSDLTCWGPSDRSAEPVDCQAASSGGCLSTGMLKIGDGPRLELTGSSTASFRNHSDHGSITIRGQWHADPPSTGLSRELVRSSTRSLPAGASFDAESPPSLEWMRRPAKTRTWHGTDVSEEDEPKSDERSAVGDPPVPRRQRCKLVIRR